MCQAVEEFEIDSELHAVDTWAGDPHTGEYGEEVYQSFTGVLDRGFRTDKVALHRMTFDQALEKFDDESVDLLHIDGFHTYEAVAHDYETWLPKLASGGIVLFHDVAPSSGVWLGGLLAGRSTGASPLRVSPQLWSRSAGTQVGGWEWLAVRR